VADREILAVLMFNSCNSYFPDTKDAKIVQITVISIFYKNFELYQKVRTKHGTLVQIGMEITISIVCN
jgi:hypothetical protein